MNFLAFRQLFPYLWNGYTYNPEAFQDYFRTLEVMMKKGEERLRI